ncbi:MAG: hypothetical protein F2563_04095 [Actinobacteria bacterium]|uniref:Unannotated protein n=1 Tax=freshwater metagenome TaxID=449393 RepID=A0A6J6F357_9ZZZZ|nr:hypothetical protein [Actinomycetota bacterium]
MTQHVAHRGSNPAEKLRSWDFTDYDGDEIDASVAHNAALNCWCVYINTAESYDKARTTTVQGVKVLLPQEVGIALPPAEAAKLRDYLTAALAEIERRTAAASK